MLSVIESVSVRFRLSSSALYMYNFIITGGKTIQVYSQDRCLRINTMADYKPKQDHEYKTEMLQCPPRVLPADGEAALSLVHPDIIAK